MMLKHPAHSLDLLPSNFHMFRLLKKALQFTMGDKMQEFVLQWLSQIMTCASMGLLSKYA
jgi:hypothetical protein